MNNIDAPALEETFDEVHEIPNEQLEGWGRKYNGSILECEGKRMFAYRRYNPRHHRCDIGIAQLDEQWEPVWSKGIEMPCESGKEHYEDPRLFIFGGKVWVATSMITDYNRRPWISIQKAFRLNRDWEVEHEIVPPIGRNGSAQEKNWQFFDYDGRLMVSYMPKNNTVYEINEEDGSVVQRWASGRAEWPYGSFSGGTPPVLWGENYLSFFHGFAECLPSPYSRRYFFGAYTFAKEPPFEMTGITAGPLSYGSGKNKWYPQPAFFGWEPYVVFPAGVIDSGNKFHISVGVNDCYNVVVGISKQELSRKLVQPRETAKAMRAFVTDDMRVSLIPSLLRKTSFRPIRVGKLGIWSVTKTLDPASIEYMESLPDVYFPLENDEYESYINGGTPKDLFVRLRSGMQPNKRSMKYGIR